jgi:hypothetical protein
MLKRLYEDDIYLLLGTPLGLTAMVGTCNREVFGWNLRYSNHDFCGLSYSLSVTLGKVHPLSYYRVCSNPFQIMNGKASCHSTL